MKYESLVMIYTGHHTEKKGNVWFENLVGKTEVEKYSWS